MKQQTVVIVAAIVAAFYFLSRQQLSVQGAGNPGTGGGLAWPLPMPYIPTPGDPGTPLLSNGPSQAVPYCTVYPNDPICAGTPIATTGAGSTGTPGSYNVYGSI